MSDNQTRPAVVLLSGGLDSATTLAMAQHDGFACHCLSVDYGQKHRFELDAAARVADRLGAASHRVVRVDLSAFGGSALTDSGMSVPKQRDDLAIAQGVPITYVPARNTVMLSLALAFAETIGSGDIFCGVNAVDYSGYPDCRPAFIEAFEAVANLATKAAVEEGRRLTVHAPLIRMSKATIIQTGLTLGVDYSMTLTCYDPAEGGLACGECDACKLRHQGFVEAGAKDPTRYVASAAQHI